MDSRVVLFSILSNHYITKIIQNIRHNPDLFIFDANGNKLEVIDLGNYDYNQLHEYFENKFGTKSDRLKEQELYQMEREKKQLNDIIFDAVFVESNSKPEMLSTYIWLFIISISFVCLLCIIHVLYFNSSVFQKLKAFFGYSHFCIIFLHFISISFFF